MEIKLVTVVLFVFYRNALCLTAERRLEEIQHSLRVLHRKIDLYEKKMTDLETSLSLCFLELTTSVQNLELVLLGKSRFRRHSSLQKGVGKLTESSDEASDVFHSAEEDIATNQSSITSCPAETPMESKQLSLLMNRMAYISDQITAAKLCSLCQHHRTVICFPVCKPRSCSEIPYLNKERQYGASPFKDGLYTIYPLDQRQPLPVYCEFNGGWTVILRNSMENDYIFDASWDEYKRGFGNPGGDFWIGNDNLYLLTKEEPVELMFVIKERSSGKISTSALVKSFHIEAEDRSYVLRIGEETDTDAYGRWFINNTKFVTKDRDSLCRGCAEKGGWWYRNNSTESLTKRMAVGIEVTIKIRQKNKL